MYMCVCELYDKHIFIVFFTKHKSQFENPWDNNLKCLFFKDSCICVPLRTEMKITIQHDNTDILENKLIDFPYRTKTEM